MMNNMNTVLEHAHTNKNTEVMNIAESMMLSDEQVKDVAGGAWWIIKDKPWEIGAWVWVDVPLGEGEDWITGEYQIADRWIGSASLGRKQWYYAVWNSPEHTTVSVNIPHSYVYKPHHKH